MLVYWRKNKSIEYLQPPNNFHKIYNAFQKGKCSWKHILSCVFVGIPKKKKKRLLCLYASSAFHESLHFWIAKYLDNDLKILILSLIFSYMAFSLKIICCVNTELNATLYIFPRCNRFFKAKEPLFWSESFSTLCGSIWLILCSNVGSI